MPLKQRKHVRRAVQLVAAIELAVEAGGLRRFLGNDPVMNPKKSNDSGFCQAVHPLDGAPEHGIALLDHGVTGRVQTSN